MFTKINIQKQLFSLRNITNLAKNNLSFTFYNNTVRTFTGKTETGWKFTTPTLRMKSVKPIIPPPGYNLQIPSILIFNCRLDS